MKHALAAFLALPALALAADKPVDAGPYVPSPDIVVTRLLELANVGANDFVVDLGSGDGRIVRTAALIFGARGFGVEIRDELVRRANEDARREGIADRVKFIKADLFKTDISQATVVTMYLLPNTVELLKDKLLNELRPGTRVLSHDYPLSGWVPEKYEQMDLDEKKKISGVTTTLIWLYVVPAKVAGHWMASTREGPLTLELMQHFNRVSGSASYKGAQVSLENIKLRGDRLTFRIAKTEFVGRARGDSIQGEADGGAWSARRVR